MLTLSGKFLCLQVIQNPVAILDSWEWEAFLPPVMQSNGFQPKLLLDVSDQEQCVPGALCVQC